MAIEIIDPLNDGRWIDFIESNPQSSIFHHPLWLNLFNNQYRFPIFAATLINNKNKIEMGIPFCEVKSISRKTNWVSLPFSDHCNPLSMNNSSFSEMEEFLINKYKERNINSIEIRDELHNSCFFQMKSEMVIHTKELDRDTDKIFSTFKKTQIQQSIRKAEKEKFIPTISNRKKSVEDFYLLHLKTRKKLGVPIQPKKFFSNLYEKIINNGLGFIVVIYSQQKPISAGVFLGYKNIITYKYSASDPDMIQYCPNHLMLWTAMKESINRGFKIFDFGKTDINNEGLRKFKSGWGSVEKPLYYSYYPNMSPNKKLKFINEKFISPLIKSSPPIVCRVIGELAYKYFPSL